MAVILGIPVYTGGFFRAHFPGNAVRLLRLGGWIMSFKRWVTGIHSWSVWVAARSVRWDEAESYPSVHFLLALGILFGSPSIQFIGGMGWPTTHHQERKHTLFGLKQRTIKMRSICVGQLLSNIIGLLVW